MAFINCHSHVHTGSNLRLRDSIVKENELIEYAKELNQYGIVITDHESITSHLNCLEYYNSVKNKEGWEKFKLGLGNEIYLCIDSCTAENKGHNVFPHFLLIALDAEGHKGIRELSTKAWMENSFYDVMYRVPTYYSDLEEMISKYKGHIIGSTACIGSPIARRLLYYREHHTDEIWGECIQWINYMIDLFSVGYFFLEIQPGTTADQIWVNQHLVKLAEETNTPYIVTCDVHYLKKEDREIHKIFLNADNKDREVDEFYQSTYLMSEEEIHSYMDDSLGYDVVQKAIDNTMLIYDKLSYYDLKKALHIPYLPLGTAELDEELYQKYVNKVPLYKNLYESQYDSDRHLLKRLLEYMEKDDGYQTDLAFFKVNECLDYLLRSSEKMEVRWSAYLLQVADYVNLAWKTGTLVGAARGSGMGFCLLFMLGITQVDPLRETTQTFPWRFLNPDRTSVLDIDVDIEGTARDKVIEAMKEVYGYDRVSKVMTLSTEKSRSAILSAGRGLGLSNDLTSYIASLVVFDRGIPRSLHTMYYGDDDYDPVPEFVREMNDNPELWTAAQKIEGLVSGVGSHAGGVIIVDEPFTNTTALMKTSSGDIITQFDLHMAEKCSLIKIDLLCIDALDKIHTALNLLLKDKKIEWQGSLKETYEKYFGIYTLERNAEDMWKLLWEHKVLSFFQMEQQSGIKAIALVKPRSVDDLAIVNSVIRLMPQTKDAEMPLNKFARFHEDIQNWYDEMDEAGLTKEEQEVLKPILTISYGMCEAQERFMQLVQLPECGGFSLQFADALRKAIAKKNPKAYLELEAQYFKETAEKGCSKNLCNYVWNTLVATSRGYGFNLAHCVSYSLIGLQELNIAYKYGTLYWSTACVIVDSGANDEESNEGTSYEKMGVAIAKIQSGGIRVANPDINTAEFGFVPDLKNNEIVYGLKGINSINTELAQEIIRHRPYKSFDDFCDKMLDTKIVKNSQMLMLIKAGCFLNLDSQDRTETMRKYLKKYQFKTVEKLTLAQMNSIQEYNIIPEDLQICVRYLNYKKYVLADEGWVENYVDETKKIPKAGYHDRYYILDTNSQTFFIEHFSEESVVRVQNGVYVLSEKKFSKEVDAKLEPLRDWFVSDNALKAYNDAAFSAVWKQFASGSEPRWSMQSLCYYDREHELSNINESEYGIVNFFDLPEEPTTYETYTRYIDGVPKQMPKYTINRLCGTVLRKNDNHHSVFLLTKYGVVEFKLNAGQYTFYNKRISAPNDKGGKSVLEESWLRRGNMLIVSGFRNEDMFIVKNYQDTIYKHSLTKINVVNPDGTLEIQFERTKI